MPLYEYRCTECGHRFEVLQAMGAGSEDLRCPRCEARRPERQLSTFAASSGSVSGASCTTPGCSAPAGFT